jgi:predicted kinase
MTLTIPELFFVALIGVSGSGKGTFARKHFKPTEILCSDHSPAPGFLRGARTKGKDQG